MAQTVTLNSSSSYHTPARFPEGIPMWGSHDPGRWPLSPPPPLILFYTTMISMCTNVCSGKHLPLLPASSLPPPTLPPSAHHVLGSGADATQALTYLYLKHPLASRQWYVVGSLLQTPGPVPGRTGRLTTTAALRSVELGLWCLFLLLKEEMYSPCIPMTRCIVWNATLPADRLFKWLNCVVMANTLLIYCFCQFCWGRTGSLMRCFISFHCTPVPFLNHCIPQSLRAEHLSRLFASHNDMSVWQSRNKENRNPPPLFAVAFQVTSHFIPCRNSALIVK